MSGNARPGRLDDDVIEDNAEEEVSNSFPA
jgi:hypothetical protein